MAFFLMKKCYFNIILPKNLHKSDKSSNFVAETEFWCNVCNTSHNACAHHRSDGALVCEGDF